ncbi:MAG TPA: hypothetical protein PKW54_11445, partial [Ferruginibacter sp.]|nr:hypothetical protein [Ferruginibacter sp.]
MTIKHIISASVTLLISIPALAQTAIRAEMLYPVSGSPIRDAVVLVQKGKIEKVGPASGVNIPAGYKVINTKVLTPGL